MAPTLTENGTRHHLRSSSLCLGRFKKNCLPLTSWLWSARATPVSSRSFFCSFLKGGVTQQGGKTGSECAKLTESLGICSDTDSLHPFLAKKRLCFTREKTLGRDFLICLRNSCFFSSQPPGLELGKNHSLGSQFAPRNSDEWNHQVSRLQAQFSYVHFLPSSYPT